MQSIKPEKLKDMLEGDRPPRLIDVREPWEFDLCHITDSENIPMSGLLNKLDQLQRDAELVVICHHGMRSREVAAYLESLGFTAVMNLDGGIDGWAIAIDPDMPQY